jgi:hypothetical protein
MEEAMNLAPIEGMQNISDVWLSLPIWLKTIIIISFIIIFFYVYFNLYIIGSEKI